MIGLTENTVQSGGKTLHFSGTFHPSDVEILLKPTAIAQTGVAEKELLIQSGRKHYSEMLSPENVPDERYMQLYREAMARNAGRLKGDIHTLATEIARRPETAQECVIISLARAGTPIGVLLKRALENQGVVAHHYSVSIIRGRGIDLNALKLIKSRHGTASSIFVDGWTGKGAIKGELDQSIAQADLGFRSYLAVVADPAGRADLAATTEDYVIPSGLLNGIVSGLISRSVLTEHLVGPDDFHACLFQEGHRPHDITNAFLDAVRTAESEVGGVSWTPAIAAQARTDSIRLVQDLMDFANVTDINRVKPGIAEATRAILRRVPDLVLVKDVKDPEIQHMLHIAAKSGAEVLERDLHNYRAVTIIKKLNGEQE